MKRFRAAVMAVAAGILALVPAGAGAASSSPPNLVESAPIAGAGAHDFNNACVSGYYGDAGTGMAGNHSESDLAVNPADGTLLGASKFFFGSIHDAGFTDFSPEYMFHLGSYLIGAKGQRLDQEIIPGYADGPGCQGSGASAGLSWSSTTDPNIAFASNGDAFAAVLPFTLYTNAQPNGAIFVNKWAHGASHWGQPVLASPLYGNTNGQGPDKQWVAGYLDPATGSEFVNACWTVFNFWASKVFCSQSVDGGATFWNAPNPVQISLNSLDGPFNTYVYPRYDASGTLYVTYMAENGAPATDAAVSTGARRGNTGVVYTAVSHDHGATFSAPLRGPAIDILPFELPNTTFRDGIPYFMYVSPNPSTPGRIYLVTEDYTAGNADVYLYESKDGGATWNASSAADHNAFRVNTNTDPSDQWQPSITADAAGDVGVAWYDRRMGCPVTNEANTCIDTFVQLFRETAGSGALTLTRNAGNVRASQFTWDPRLPVNPSQPTCGDDLPHPDAHCSVSFIGDYFGTAIGNGNLYVLNVSTHDFGGNRFNDQQQVLQVVPIPAR